MSDREPVAEPGPYEPQHPTLLAALACTLWPAVLSLPMLGGLWLASHMSDQYLSGAGQAWSAEWMKRLGHLPLWNPEIFGGLPFVAAGGGDVFYPTWLLRFVIGATAAGNLSFFVHYVLAGLFTYLLLRQLRLPWTAAVVGGLAYELSGLIASYPSPGHDGKLFASAALPLAFLALVLAVRDRRWEGYPLLAAAVALALLGHFQLAYYLLIAAGLFALYLTLEEARDRSSGARVLGLGLALVAVLVGFGIAAIQILPFFEYIPFSPRAEGYYGFAGSTSYAIPWDHIPEFVLKNFVGATPRGTYWGSNPIKLHSEYLGLPVVALAVLGARVPERRRFLLWVGGIGVLFLLISLGAGTPFYKLWWAVMPLVKKTRAPGMAFFVVAFVTAILAGVGAERALGKEGRRATTPLLVIGGLVALLAVLGVWGQLAHSLASSIQAATGKPALAAASADQAAIRWGAFGSGVALAAAAAVCVGLARLQLTPRLAALFLVCVVGADLLINAWGFWSYMPPYRRDALIDRVAATPVPYRVLNTPDAYAGAELMAFDVPQMLGYHGNELRYYDELMGGKNEWRNLRYLKLWDLLAVRYAILPAAASGADSLPGFRRILDGVRTSDSTPLRLFERIAPAPYARVVPGALKADSEVIITTLVDPRVGMDYSRLVLFTPDQPVSPAPITALPPPSPSHASVTAWEPGHMTISLAPAPPAPSYVLVAENWYPGWEASVDARPVRPLRGDYSLLTVPVAAGATTVELTFRSLLYERGKTLSHISLVLLVVAMVGSVALGRRRRA